MLTAQGNLRLGIEPCRMTLTHLAQAKYFFPIVKVIVLLISNSQELFQEVML